MNRRVQWSANNGEYLLEITSDALGSLENECSRAENTETGGILIGYYSTDHLVAYITEISIPPPDSSFGNNWFQRGVQGLRLILINRWHNSSFKTYYIGEWHYHPAFQVTLSNVDIKQMNDICRSPNYHCKKPILLIAGKKQNTGRQIRLYIFPIGEVYCDYSILTSD